MPEPDVSGIDTMLVLLFWRKCFACSSTLYQHRRWRAPDMVFQSWYFGFGSGWVRQARFTIGDSVFSRAGAGLNGFGNPFRGSQVRLAGTWRLFGVIGVRDGLSICNFGTTYTLLFRRDSGLLRPNRHPDAQHI